jgi:hypothetical protein
MPTLNNLTVTVTEVVQVNGQYRVNVNTSAMGVFKTWNHLNKVTRYSTAIPLRGVTVRADSMMQGHGVVVETRVEGYLFEACARVPVTWSCATGGTFSEVVSLTDEDGYATTIYYPPVGGSGNYVIDATVNW